MLDTFRGVSMKDLGPRIGAAIGQEILDLKFLIGADVLESLSINLDCLKLPTPNHFAILEKNNLRLVRTFLRRLMVKDTDLGSLPRDSHSRRQVALHHRCDIQMHLPIRIGNFTDFLLTYTTLRT